MAEVVAAGGEPVNRGEELTVEALRDGLGDDVRLIANWEVVHPTRSDECDVIVISPDGVFIVEVKYLFHAVVAEENAFFKGGKKLPTHPWHLTNHKARRLRSKLNDKLPWFIQDGWVEPLVVLAREPEQLEVDPLMANRVVLLDRAVELLRQGSILVPANRRGRLTGRVDAVVHAIIGSGREAGSDGLTVPGYRMDETLFAEPGYSRFLATLELTDQQFTLEWAELPAAMTGAAAEGWRAGQAEVFKTAQLIGPHARVIEPRACFDLDDGSVVTIWPAIDAAPLSLHLATADAPLSSEEAERIAADIADALAHLHAKGFAHGAVSADTIEVLFDGHGVVWLGHASRRADTAAIASDRVALADIYDRLFEASSTVTLRELADGLRGGQLSPSDARDRLTMGVVSGDGAASGRPSLWDTYTLTRPLTEDPARTFLARDVGGEVVVKLLAGLDAEDPETWSEYRVLRDLNHDCIVRALGAGIAAEGPYLVTAYLDGPSLREAIDAHLVPSMDRALATVLKLLGALDAMHPDADARRELTTLERTETDTARLRSLRDSGERGVVHNDIRPENVRLVGGRRPVLFDFDLAARPGALVGVVASAYRPEDLPAGEAAVDADLYAVGVMLHELLTGALPYRIDSAGRRVLAVDESLPSAIAEVIRQACAPRQAKRYRTARQFIEALVTAGVGDGLGIEVEPDAADLLRRIDTLWRTKDFDAALDLCPPHWERLQERLSAARAAAGATDIILVIDGVELHRVGERLIGPGETAGTKRYLEARAQVYRAVLPEGGYIDFAYARSEDAGEAWIHGLETMHVPARLKRLEQGLRASEQQSPDQSGVYIRLRQARLTPEKGPDWSTAFKASLDELDTGAGCKVADVLISAGARAVDTQERAIGDTGRMRSEMCVVYDPDQPGDVPALAYFVTRVMPLYRSVSS